MTEDQIRHYKNRLAKFIPEESVSYCCHLWQKFPFHLKITRPRKSKLGDYRYDPGKRQHYISVNLDLNPYAFLVTYLHEVAHLVAFQKYGRKAAPHGQEWKAVFSHLLEPVIRRQMVPADVLDALARYMKNPKASSCSDANLTLVLGKYDPVPKKYLDDIPSGEVFQFQDRIFRKGNLRRTRYVCAEVKSGKQYLISKHAEIKSGEDQPRRRTMS
ncbi:SprT-like domain-containing protein [Fulvivirga sedimenti]|uniref:SprT-like domain-containing protein n=1 Tax=Fulvivirga sedimenti TaxID=2879465 RepID=A0A9X1HPE8_9BACT|nr:SprT-like domain-containing protein [Fulvivirga sedimenti]